MFAESAEVSRWGENFSASPAPDPDESRRIFNENYRNFMMREMRPKIAEKTIEKCELTKARTLSIFTTIYSGSRSVLVKLENLIFF